MENTEGRDLVETLSRSALFFQEELCDSSMVLANTFAQVVHLGHFCRKTFQELHFGYEPVPEVYLRSEVFDKVFQPRQYLQQLRDELARDVEVDIFLEALGCYLVLDDERRKNLNSNLRIAVPLAKPQQRAGLVRLCWDRIHAAAEKLGESAYHLLLVVAFHEYSHAARSAALLRSNRPEILQAEETVAQWETYMFLRSRNEETAIAAMKKLMEKQPNCYRIPIP